MWGGGKQGGKRRRGDSWGGGREQGGKEHISLKIISGGGWGECLKINQMGFVSPLPISGGKGKEKKSGFYISRKLDLR